MKGGRAHWPILDAVYIAHHLLPSSNQDRRVIIAILEGDAMPVTTGKLHSGVLPGIEPEKIAWRSTTVLFILNWMRSRSMCLKVAGAAGKKLRQFKDANLDALNKGQSVWMPVSQLP